MRLLVSLGMVILVGCGSTLGGGLRHSMLAGPPAGNTPRSEALAHYLTALLHQRDGRYEDYVAELNKAAELAPDSTSILSRLGEAHMRMQDYEKARESYEKAVKRSPDDAVLWVWLGAAYQQLERYEDAAGAFQKAIELAPDNPLGYQALIDAETSSNDFVATVDLYRKLIEMRPESAELYMQLGGSLVRIEDTAGARDALQRALELDPTLKRARYSLGFVLLDLGEPVEAARQFELFLKDDPQEVSAIEGLAGALARQGRYDRALEQIDRIVESETGNASHLVQRVYLMLRAGRAQEAAAMSPPNEAPLIGTLLRALARKKAGEPYLPLIQSLDDAEGAMDLEARRYLGGILSLFGSKDAGAFFANELQALRNDGAQSTTVDFLLGRTYLVLERYREAEAVLAPAAQRRPDDKTLLFELAGVYDKLDNFVECEKALKACLALDPTDAEVMNFLGYLYAEENVNLDEALALLTKALATDPDNPFYLDSLGWVYYRKGDGQRAVEYIRKAILLMDTDDDAILRDHLGDAYLLIGEVDKAIAEWQRARRLDPKLEGVQQKIDAHRNATAEI